MRQQEDPFQDTVHEAFSDSFQNPPYEETQHDFGQWLLVGLGFFWWAPFGVILLFLKLFGLKNCMQGVREIMSFGEPEFKGKTFQFQKKSNNPWTDLGQNVTSAIQGKMTEVQQAQHKKYVLRKLRSHGDEQTWLCGFFSLIFSVPILSSLPFPSTPEVVLFLSACYGTYHGMEKQKSGKRMLQYYNIVEGSKQFSIDKISSVLNIPTKIIRKDLEEMIAMGFLKDGFLDHSNNTLVLQNREEYLIHHRAQQEAADLEAALVEKEHSLLAEIRGVNTKIQNKSLSAQIDHITMISSKILEYLGENNNKERELNRFLRYYLPTTLKILNSYSELEAQGIEGENITKTKKQIEEMMDKIVEGFEKQLDQLFQADTMDIAADITVLEQMLEKDGLSGRMPSFDSTDFTKK